MSARRSSRVVRAGARRLATQNAARKTKYARSHVHQSASAQVVTDFCGPLDNGQRSTKVWLPPALFSHVRSLRVATVAVACSQVGPGVFLLVFLAPLMHPQRRSARHSSRVTCASATRIAEQNAARKKFCVVACAAKRKYSSGNRISWTSGQWTEVHKILVTPCRVIKGALTLNCDS